MPILTYSLHCFGIISANGLLTLRLHICHFVCVSAWGQSQQQQQDSNESAKREGRGVGQCHRKQDLSLWAPLGSTSRRSILEWSSITHINLLVVSIAHQAPTFSHHYPESEPGPPLLHCAKWAVFRARDTDRQRRLQTCTFTCLHCLWFVHPLSKGLASFSCWICWHYRLTICGAQSQGLTGCRLVVFFIAFHLLFLCSLPVAGRPIGHAVLCLLCQEERRSLCTLNISISSSQSTSVIWPELASHLSRLLHRVSSITSTHSGTTKISIALHLAAQHSPSLATESIVP